MGRKSVIAIAAVVAVVAAAAALLIAGVGTATADEVRFQNVSDPGPAPFTAPTDVAKTSSKSSSSTEDTSASSSSSTSESSSTESTDTTETSPSEPTDPSSAGGSEGSSDSEPKPGTFGGSGKNKVCDREKLIKELLKDPDKLSAWADTVGIDADAQTVADFIRKLRPVTLTEDTQVTNHSFVDGSAKAYQAILPKGTAVLADDSGKPVARCRCGNPLDEPVQLEQETKCINCPANYTPPKPCEGKCYRVEVNPPPTDPIGTPTTPTTPTMPTTPATNEEPIVAAKKALDACRKSRGSLGLCQTEYEKANGLCRSDPLNAACDATVCFDPVKISVHFACPSILGDADIRFQCSFSLFVAACEKENLALRDRCANNATLVPECVNNSAEGLANILRLNCQFKPALPECKALQLGCVKDPSQSRCAELQDTCVKDPSRVDCKAASEALQKCAKDPSLPECKGVDPQQAKKALTTLKGEDEPAQEGEQPAGEEGTGEAPTVEEGTGESTGGDTGGGDTGGGEAPTTETPQPDTTTPEGQ